MVEQIIFDMVSDCEPLPISTKAMKRTSGWFKRWQPRYLSLADRRLTYKRFEEDDTGSRVLDFDLISVDLKYQDNTVEILPLRGKRSFSFKFSSNDEASQWVSLLKSHIESSKGQIRELPHFIKQKHYWRHNYVSETEFIRQANTGDILLFRGCNSLAKVQRAFTRSKYDHVALVMRYSTGQLAFFEAIQGEGVTIVRWDEFKQNNWQKLYSRIAYRQLSTDRSQKVLQDLQDFIDRVNGRHYRVSIAKLCGSRPSQIASNEANYFCSELTGVCLQVMGCLPSDLRAGQFLPGDFSIKRKLPFINGASLGPELFIDFDID